MSFDAQSIQVALQKGFTIEQALKLGLLAVHNARLTLFFDLDRRFLGTAIFVLLYKLIAYYHKKYTLGCQPKKQCK